MDREIFLWCMFGFLAVIGGAAVLLNRRLAKENAKKFRERRGTKSHRLVKLKPQYRFPTTKPGSRSDESVSVKPLIVLTTASNTAGPIAEFVAKQAQPPVQGAPPVIEETPVATAQAVAIPEQPASATVVEAAARVAKLTPPAKLSGYAATAAIFDKRNAVVAAAQAASSPATTNSIGRKPTKGLGVPSYLGGHK